MNLKHGTLLLALVAGMAGTALAQAPQNDKPRMLARPPFTAPKGKAGRGKNGTKVRLIRTTERRRAYEDEAVWFKRYGLKKPVIQSNLSAGNRGEIPPDVPESVAGARLINAIIDGPRLQLLYGPDFSGARYVVGYVPGDGEPLYTLDFSRYLDPPSVKKGEKEFVTEGVQWAHEASSDLFVSNFHRTYAKSSGGQNGYITALNPRSGDFIWRSRPLVCNSNNFLILGDAIVSGYGFTAEKDYLYVLSRNTGDITQTIPLRSGPEWIIRKEDKVYVRCYDADYVFRIVSK